MQFHIWGHKNIFYGFMERNDVIWYWWRQTRNKCWSHAYRKIKRKYYWIIIKNSEYLYLSWSRCCTVFNKNCNSFSIQIGRPKFPKFSYFSKISQFYSDFKRKYIFIISMIVWLRKIHFLCLSVNIRFEMLFFRFKLKRQYFWI